MKTNYKYRRYLHLFENKAIFGTFSYCPLIALSYHEDTAVNDALSVISYVIMIAYNNKCMTYIIDCVEVLL